MSATDADLRDLVVSRLELLSQADFDKARATAARLRVPLERVLIERARIPMTFLLEQLAHAWSVGFIDVKPGDVAPEALAAVGEVYARTHKLVPMLHNDKELHVAMTNPRDARVIDEIERMTGRRVVPFLAPETSIRRAQLLYRGDLGALLERTAAHEATGALTGGVRDEAASALLDRILEYAAVTDASDIHIEPYELETLVRCRIDGALRDVLSVAPETVAGLVARIKILGGMRIDDRRTPQDGRFDANLDGLRLALRVSSLPTLWGEKVVLRILSEEATAIDLDDLGLAPSDYQTFVRNLARPFGMVLVTGPTGSGKTTTLYAMLARIGAERQNVVNISTVEDPVEFRLPRVNQVPVNPVAGLDFASGLRALLRQDPDVIMVGEMRDRETAEIAVRAALVGRLVISTLHTNDATAAVARLLDMGIEPFLLASTLSFVVGQRLVRRICMKCRQSVTLDSRLSDLLRARPDFDGTVAMLRKEGVLGPGDDPLAGLRMFRGNGCRQCNGTGYYGRLGIYEAFEVDREAHAMIMARTDGASLRAAAIARGMKTMFQDGLAKVFLGQTTLEEVLRVAQ